MTIGFAAAVFPATAVKALTIDIFASSDNTLFESIVPFDPGSAEANRSNGSGPYIFTGRTFQNGDGLLRRGLLSFDVGGALPAGSILTSANLSLYVSKSISTDTDVALHRVSSAWGEGASDSGAPGGAGASAMPGDATWLHTDFDSAVWTVPGGDFNPFASAVTAVGSESLFYTWSGPGLLDDLQYWLDNPALNYGWVIIGDELTAGSAKRFDSRERFDFDFDTGRRTAPILSIQYTVIPEPAAALLLAFGGLLVFSAPRNRR